MVRYPGVPPLLWQALCWIVAPAVVFLFLCEGDIRWLAVPCVALGLLGIWVERRRPTPVAKALAESVASYLRQRGVGVNELDDLTVDVEADDGDELEGLRIEEPTRVSHSRVRAKGKYVKRVTGVVVKKGSEEPPKAQGH